MELLKNAEYFLARNSLINLKCHALLQNTGIMIDVQVTYELTSVIFVSYIENQLCMFVLSEDLETSIKCSLPCSIVFLFFQHQY